MKLTVPRAGLIFVALNLLFIIFYASPIYFWDEWRAIVGMLNTINADRFSFAILWEPHNEHRMVLSKMVIYLFSLVSVDPRWIMPISTFLCWLTLLELNRVIRFLPDSLSPRMRAALCIGLAGFFFSWLQAENFFWGIQLCYFISSLGNVGAITSAVEKRYLRMFGFFLLAYLSTASWMATVPFIVLAILADWRRLDTAARKRALAAAVTFGTLATIGLLIYVRGNHHAEEDRLTLGWFTDPPRLMEYWLMLTGVLFEPMGREVAFLMGFIFVATFVWLFVKHRSWLTTTEICLILFTLLLPLLIANRRAGPWNFLIPAPNRYSTFLLPGWMAMFAVLIRGYKDRRRVLIAISLVLLINVVDTDKKRYDFETGMQATRTHAGECLTRVLDSPQPKAEDLECIRFLSEDSVVERARIFRARYHTF